MMDLPTYIFRRALFLTTCVCALQFSLASASGQTPGFVPYTPNPVYQTAGYANQVLPPTAPPQMLPQPAVADPFAVRRSPAFGYAGALSPRPVYNVAQVPQSFPQPQQFPQQQFVQPQISQPQFSQPQFPQPQQFPQPTFPQQPMQPGFVPQNYAVPGFQQPYAAPGGMSQFLNTNPQNTWTTQFSWLYMTRAKPSSFPLLIDAGGMTLVDANELDFGWNSGFDVALSRKTRNGANVELRDFQINGWSANFSAPFAATNAIATNLPSDLAGAGVVDYAARSSLYSFEINLVDRSVNNERVQFSLGFRWMEVSENLAQTFNPAGPPSSFVIDTNNHLYGAQGGIQGVFFDGARFNIVGWGKGGLYGNVGDQSTDVSTGGILIATAEARDTVASFVGETGMLLEYKMFPRASLIGGYQLLWISGAALAPDQLPNMGSIAAGLTPTGLDQSTAYYHGLFAGVDIHW